MINFNDLFAYFKEASQNIKFQIAASITFGAVLYLAWSNEYNYLKILPIILFLFPTCILICSIIEKIADYFHQRKEQKLREVHKKLGLLGKHQYSYKHKELWADKNFQGLGWQIVVH